MRRRAKHYVIFLMLFLFMIALAACNKTTKTSDNGTPAPTVTLSPTSEPTLTPAPTATPIPTREDILAGPWFDECKMIDCEEYYFEMLSFKEREVGGYAMEVVFENRQPFAVYVGISDVYINFLRHPYDRWPLDWSDIMVGPGKRETIEFWIPDYYANQLKITKAEDFNCASFTFIVEAVADDIIEYSDYEEIMFYRYGRENGVPFEHVLTEDDVALVDREDVKFYLTDFAKQDSGFYTVHFYWENNTEHYLYYRFYNESVNGYACDSFWTENVCLEPGTCGYDYFGFYAYELEDYEITSVTEIEFDASLYYDSGIWQWTDLVKDTFCVYPLGQEAAQKQERELQDTDVLVLDTDEYKIVITDFLYEKNKYNEKLMEGKMKVYLVNKTDCRVQFVLNEAKFNGEEFIDKFNSRNVSPGKSLYWELSWDDRERKIDDFLHLDSLELRVQIKNMDDEKQSVVLDECVNVIP